MSQLFTGRYSDLFYTDTSLIRTLRSVLSVSVLERFDCKWYPKYATLISRNSKYSSKLLEGAVRSTNLNLTDYRPRENCPQTAHLHFSNDHFLSGFCHILSRFNIYSDFLEPYLNAILHGTYWPQCALSLLYSEQSNFVLKLALYYRNILQT